MGVFIKDYNQLDRALNQWRPSKKLVFTNGCFDILHVGHVRYLQQARALGDGLLVALNTDRSVKALGKGDNRPLNPQDARGEVMAALGCVDFVTLFDEDTPLQLIQRVRPDVLVKGGDWKVEQIVGGPLVQAYGGTVKSLQFVDGYSTTKIIEKMK